ncbi:MAG TPA: VanZ family protein, partial [Gemmatimonadaceae bacterium]
MLYFLGVILVITLAPFRFALPEHVDVMPPSNAFDVVANIFLFVPLGFLYPLSRSEGDEVSPARVFLLGILLSGAIEATQIFERERFPSVVDVLTNGTGAAFGALLVRGITRRIRVNAQLVGRLSLEIPLIGLIYLLVPLVVVVSLGAVDQSLRMVSLVPLGLVGARLLSAAQLNHFGPAGLLGARTMAGVAGGWMVMGTFPVLLRHPIVGLALVGVVIATTWIESSRAASGAFDRRFETNALRSAAPYIVVYFLV